jgi:hypothetical protein
MPATAARHRRARSSQRCLRLALGFFLLRALIPVGFMPAPLGSGGPVMVCNGGFAGAFFATLAANRSTAAMSAHLADSATRMPSDMGDPSAATPHEHGSGTGGAPDRAHEGWEHCSFGTAASFAALAQDFVFDLLSLEHALADTEPASTNPVAFFSSYQARAPPGSPRRLT